MRSQEARHAEETVALRRINADSDQTHELIDVICLNIGGERSSIGHIWPCKTRHLMDPRILWSLGHSAAKKGSARGTLTFSSENGWIFVKHLDHLTNGMLRRPQPIHVLAKGDDVVRQPLQRRLSVRRRNKLVSKHKLSPTFSS